MVSRSLHRSPTKKTPGTLTLSRSQKKRIPNQRKKRKKQRLKTKRRMTHQVVLVATMAATPPETIIVLNLAKILTLTIVNRRQLVEMTIMAVKILLMAMTMAVTMGEAISTTI